MDNLISNLLLESIFNFGKWAHQKYANTRISVIFSLTTPKSQKLIPKADLEWECPYFYSKILLMSFDQYNRDGRTDCHRNG